MDLSSIWRPSWKYANEKWRRHFSACQHWFLDSAYLNTPNRYLKTFSSQNACTFLNKRLFLFFFPDYIPGHVTHFIYLTSDPFLYPWSCDPFYIPDIVTYSFIPDNVTNFIYLTSDPFLIIPDNVTHFIYLTNDPFLDPCSCDQFYIPDILTRSFIPDHVTHFIYLTSDLFLYPWAWDLFYIPDIVTYSFIPDHVINFKYLTL